MIKSLQLLRDLPVQIIHLTGARDERLVADNYLRENISAYVAAFHQAMEIPYSAADVVIARAGAASLAEIAFFALPAILIPYPYSADDHQTRNAEIFMRAGAAILLKESELSIDLLASKIKTLIGDTQQLQLMSQNCAKLAPKNAASLVVSTMEKYTTHEARL
jgi:UDP-N-acetylglucosamine--N-acetylmuramyl-(pentapeptide) pyrophosphoryl-undecaprenol N-acetylglucosamine transferase